MGAVFAEEILGIANPEVRLLSIGEEREKGNQLTLEAHELLAASDLNFAGNAEGRDVLAGAADVLVTDGFTGNVALKAVEGTIRTLLESLREEITATPRGKLGGLLIRPAAAAAAPQARSGHVRRRLSARPAGPRGDRPRQLLEHRDRQCDPPRGPGRGARRGRRARHTASPAGRDCMIGRIFSPQTEQKR